MGVNFVASWRPGADKIYSKSVNVQKVAEEIISVGNIDKLKEDKFKNIQPEDVVEMARDECKESHKLFEWDNNIAAEKYRIVQARHIMHDIHVVYYETEDKKPEKIGVPVRLFYNLKDESGYRPTPVIMQNKDMHKKLLMTAQSELEAFMKKYRILSELEPLLKTIEEYIYKYKIFDK